MTDTKHEASQPASISEEAIKALEAEGHTFSNDGEESDTEDTPDPKKDEAPEKTPAEDEEAPKDEDSEDDSDESDEDEDKSKDAPAKVGRTPKYIPAWKAKVAETKHEQEKNELLKQLELARNGHVKENDSENKDELKGEIEKIGEKYNTDPEFLKEVLGLVGKANKVPADLLERFEQIESEKEDDRQEKFFNDEFEKEVLPSIKAELPEISESALQKIKDKLHTLAFTEEYATLALKKVYRIESDSIKAIIPPPKKKVEIETKGARTRIVKTVDEDNVTEEDVENMSPEELESFTAKKRSGGWK